MLRVGLLTSKLAKGLLADHLKSIELSGIETVIVDLPLHSISLVSAETLAKVISRRDEVKEKLRDVDLVLVPGSVRGDVAIVSHVLGKPVFKASRALYHLPAILKHVSEGRSLDTTKAAEELLRLTEPQADYLEAFRVGDISIPLRGPPLVLAAEAVAGLSREGFSPTIARFLREGAKIIVVGSSFDMSVEELSRRVSLVVDTGSVAVAEVPTVHHAKSALSSGAHGLSISAEMVAEVAPLLSPHNFLVLGDRDLLALSRAVEEAKSLGIHKIILDPIVGVPLVDFAATAQRYLQASSLNLPLWFSAANAQEEVEADSHGVHAVLAFLAVELRASVYAVVEDSPKSVHSTAEAKEALRIASLHYLAKTSPKGAYSRLLVVKRGRRGQSVQEGEADVVGHVEPQMDERGYLRIHVDHERGDLVVTFYGREGNRLAFRGREATSLARAVVRRTAISAEHAAYLGYELAKAEMALKLGIDYEQDEPLFATPWEET
ncbi:MAG: dihydropteroate synthase-like protein [Acidilobaceae archaeon]|nr:dihydropteroate synthase-like protein [Acidilobaceae archaeon]